MAVRAAAFSGADKPWGRPLYRGERTYCYARTPGQPAIA